MGLQSSPRRCLVALRHPRLLVCLVWSIAAAAVVFGWSSMEWSVALEATGGGVDANVAAVRQASSHPPADSRGHSAVDDAGTSPLVRDAINLHQLPVQIAPSGVMESTECVALPSAHDDHGMPAADMAAKLRRLRAAGDLNAEKRHMTTASEPWRLSLRQDLCDMRFEGNPGKVTQQNLDKANGLQWMRTSGLLVDVVGCSAALSNLPRPSVALRNPVPWQGNVAALTPLPLGDARRLPAAAQRRIAQTTFVRVPKSASWVVGRDVCATCSKDGAFYMNPRHSCFFTLWGVGEAAKLKKLASTSRGGRNAIFKEREGSFQYGGIVPSSVLLPANDSVGQFGAASQSPHHHQRTIESYVRGTTVWLGSYEGDNVGHVIHDALWAVQIALMLPEILSKDGKARREAVYPEPVRAVFAQDFERISSQYFGALSWVVANGEQARAARRDRPPLSLHRSPFSNMRRQDGMVCFEQLVIPGQDRHVDGGGLGLRATVARRIREHVFAALESSASPDAPAAADGSAANSKPPVVYVYGRNDVHRRSFDNTAALYRVAALVSRDLQLPAPILIDTFNRAPEAQWSMMRGVDVLLAIQGSHMQNSLFMPEDAAIIELAPCRADRVSFIQRYGKYLDTQSYTYLSLCDGVAVNYSDQDPASQNVTLCPHMLARIQVVVATEVRRLLDTRRRKKQQSPG